MNLLRFRRLVRAVLLSAGPSAAAVTPGCSSSSDVTEMPERAQCVDLQAVGRYAALTPSPGVDGIVLATRGNANVAPAPSAGPLPRLAPVGMPCATAKDRDACSRSVDALLDAPESVGWVVRLATSCGDCDRPTVYDLGVITKRDSVRLATLEDVVAAVTPVDNRNEAATILSLKGYGLDCDMNNVRPEADGWTFKRTSRSCSGAVDESFWKVLTASGEVVAAGTHQVREADTNCIEGRRPANLASTGVAWLSSLAACFSEIAHMEAAAVVAFDELEHQLRGLGAPPDLLARAARARVDEIAHAAMTEQLALRFGGAAREPRIESAPVSCDAEGDRPLLRFALENAVEGCVREAYGAVVAAHQAAHAGDAEVRAVFSRVAHDEAEHAELSFDLDAWLAPQLTEGERARVDAAKARAWLDLASACRQMPAPEVMAVAGLPSADVASALLAELAWAVQPLAA